MDGLYKRWLNYSLCFILSLYIITFSNIAFATSPTIPKPVNTTEIRGVWLTNVGSGVLFTPWGINRAIKQLATLKFNRVYPVVWNRDKTFYKSQIAKKVIGVDSEPLLNIMRGGRDILKEIIALSQARNISVIPWFEYGLMTLPNSELTKRHPDWLTNTWSSQVVNKQDNFTVTHLWLNPLHPDVKNFIKSLIVEVVTNYDVNGIQLDDHFAMPVTMGYDPYTIKIYQQEHQGQNPPIDIYNPEWMSWRANKLTLLMTEINQAVKAIKPNFKIILSPNSKAFSYKYYLQDWQTWVEKGLVDELILQVYRDDEKAFANELQQPGIKFAQQKIPVGVAISTGTFKNTVDIQQIQQQVKIVRQNGLAGVSFFYWESLWGYISPESPKQRRQGFQEIFSS
jgi:uncharacterized lipoprotein YddW (UPF0748 family)